MNPLLQDNKTVQVIRASQHSRGPGKRNSASHGRNINFPHKIILKLRYLSKGRPLTCSMHNFRLSLGLAQNLPQVAQFESFSVPSKGVILKGLSTNLVHLRLEYRKRKNALFVSMT